MKEDLQNIAVTVAHEMGLDAALVCAVIANESSWDPHPEPRYEPKFFNRYISTMTGLSDEEKRFRATSFGLMQVMGQLAREYGFTGTQAELEEPLNNIKLGCRKLQKCISRETHEHGTYAGDVAAALLRYNGGGDAHYPDRVMEYYQDYAHLNSATGQA